MQLHGAAQRTIQPLSAACYETNCRDSFVTHNSRGREAHRAPIRRMAHHNTPPHDLSKPRQTKNKTKTFLSKKKRSFHPPRAVLVQFRAGRGRRPPGLPVLKRKQKKTVPPQPRRKKSKQDGLETRVDCPAAVPLGKAWGGVGANSTLFSRPQPTCHVYRWIERIPLGPKSCPFQ